MQLTFAQKSSKRGLVHGVYLTQVNGDPVTPVPVFLSSSRKKSATVLNALTGGLVKRVTQAVLEAIS